MAQQTQTTTDHDTIRQWVEQRGGRPATVKGTEEGGGVGVLRIDFSGSEADDSLQDLGWDTFFARFDESEMAFLYQEQTSDGQPSRFGRFVRR